MVVHVVPEYSKSAVGRASKLVGKGTGTVEQLAEARAILSNFRSAHAFPLNAVTVTVRQKALAVDPNAVVAQRLKRLPTILDKLVRISTMSVTTMHDLGGCRVVFESVGDVERLVDVLRDLPRSATGSLASTTTSRTTLDRSAPATEVCISRTSPALEARIPRTQDRTTGPHAVAACLGDCGGNDGPVLGQ